MRPQTIIDQKLGPLSAAERSTLLDDLAAGRPEALAWLEKIRRFVSLYGRRLSSEARSRFSSGANDHLTWMARFLLEGCCRSPERGQAPLDSAMLNAALYCIDAAPSNTALAAGVEQKVGELQAWLLTVSPCQMRERALGTGFDYRGGLWQQEAKAARPLVIVAPSPYSLPALCVLAICLALGLPVRGILIRAFSADRFMHEMRRDGSQRLAKKIWRKLILRSDENAVNSSVSLAALAAALTMDTPDIRVLAARHGITVMTVKDFGLAVDQLRAMSPSLAIFTGGGLINQSVIDVFGLGILNIHMGPLPQYKGMDVVQAPILDGCFNSVGLTGHLMAAALDGGPVLSRYSINSDAYAHLGQLRNELSAVAPLMAIDTALGLFSGRLTPQVQMPAGRQYYFIHHRLRDVIEIVLQERYERLRDDVMKDQVGPVVNAVLADFAGKQVQADAV